MPTLVEKTVVINQKVEDLWGLFMDLRKADFKVRNVGADFRGTYVHLELDEEKDPAPIVDAWVGKPSPKSSPILKEIRTKELKKVKEEEEVRLQAKIEQAKKIDEAKSRGEVLAVAAPDEGTPPAQTDSVGFLKRIFRKFF